MRCLTCNASRYKTNDDNANDGSMDNNDRKKRGGGEKKKNTSRDHQDEGEEDVNERKILALVMWYLPVIDCLKRMFLNYRDVMIMIWHATLDGHDKDGKL
jgi:hypothetical protein